MTLTLLCLRHLANFLLIIIRAALLRHSLHQPLFSPSRLVVAVRFDFVLGASVRFLGLCLQVLSLVHLLLSVSLLVQIPKVECQQLVLDRLHLCLESCGPTELNYGGRVMLMAL